MKILFATGKLNAGFSATNKIISQLAAELAAKGHSCTVCGLAADCKENITVEKGVTMARLNSNLAVDKAQLCFDSYSASLGGNARSTARRRFMLRHPVHAAALAYRYSEFFDSTKRAEIYARRIKELVLREKFDAAVISYLPFDEAMHTAKTLSGIVPVCLYQADPWGLHREEKFAKDAQLHIQQETELFCLADHIITTPALYRLYLQDENYKPFADKMTAMNFPNIRPPQQSNEESIFDFDADAVNLLFCGLLEDEYRSPGLFLQTAAGLIDGGLPLKIYFLGTSTSKELMPFIRKYPQNVVHHQAVSLDKAVATMKKADILLNISNTLDNQVPSKIFDYFSLGKPVINVQKIENCPSREYFDRYPLAFTLCDRVPDTAALEDFLLSAKGKTIDFDTVSQLFYDATLEYAAEKCESIVTDIL
ncbi:MAG: glycosyltransferase family 4 protein [Ruminococcaceae bacterium]|nr:glycosyltransferase family 4 protein [Oscillospiraceae bacterium]